MVRAVVRLYHVIAQILIRSDQAILHPVDVLNENGLPVETHSARLKWSKITNKYLAHGYHNVNVQFSHNTQNVMNTVQNSSNEKDRYNHVMVKDVSDDSDQITSQQCTVQVHTAAVSRPARHIDAIELHPDQTGIKEDDQGVYTLL